MKAIEHWAVPLEGDRYAIVVQPNPGDWRVAGELFVVHGRKGHPTVYVADDKRQFTGSDPAADVIRHVCVISADPDVRVLARGGRSAR